MKTIYDTREFCILLGRMIAQLRWFSFNHDALGPVVMTDKFKMIGVQSALTQK